MRQLQFHFTPNLDNHERLLIKRFQGKPWICRWVALILALVLLVSFPIIAAAGGCGFGQTNILPNCDFDGDVSLWTASPGLGSISWDPDGNQAPGSLRMHTETIGTSLVESDCFNASGIAGEVQVNFGAQFKESVLTVVDCHLLFNTYSSGDCSSGLVIWPQSQLVNPTSTNYGVSLGSATSVPADVLSGDLTLVCGGDVNSEILVDDAFVGVGLKPVVLESFSIE